MSSRRFTAGENGRIGGIRWRVREGRKGLTDLVLDLEGSEGFAPAKMALGGLMADFFFENEDHLYPRGYGGRGGDLYINYILSSARNGWQAAAEQLEIERRLRAERKRRDAA